MTIITGGGLSEKKSSQKQPLVGSAVGEDVESSIPDDVNIENGKSGANDASRVKSALMVARVVTARGRRRASRVNSLTSLCVLLTALMVLATGILGGVYLYRQFTQYRMNHFRGWCSIPYIEQPDDGGDEVAEPLHGSNYVDLQSQRTTPKLQIASLKHEKQKNFEDIMSDLEEKIRRHEKLNKQNGDGSSSDGDSETVNPYDHFFDEEFDIDIEFEQYERIEVPDFSHGRRGRFIHDFSENKTGIIDLEEGRCFVMPLNRTMVLPPQSLYDLVTKMRKGYYDIDTEIVRDKYRVLTPAIDNLKSVGYFIARECANMPTYRLERITSPVFKRSPVEHKGKTIFAEFAGKKISEIEIVNLHHAVGNKK